MGRVEHIKDTKHVDYYLAVSELKKFCSTKSFSYKEFEVGIRRMFRVEDVRKDLLFGVKGPTYRTNALKISMGATEVKPETDGEAFVE